MVVSDGTATSGPDTRVSNNKARINIGDSGGDDIDDASMEIILDIHNDDTVVPPTTASGAKKSLEKKLPSVKQRTLSRIKQVSLDLKRLATVSRRFSTTGRLVINRNKSAAAHALKGLKFITAAQGGPTGWPQVEKRFDQLTASTDDGLLHCSKFGQCIGMDKKSKEFANGLFRALAQRLNISGDSINKQELREFWDQVSGESFDSRLHTFLAMVDKDADGKITEEEVTEMISLSASANKLNNIQKQAKEYAALIMEELDPDNIGYIMIENLEILLLDAPNQSMRLTDGQTLNQMLNEKLKPTKESNIMLRWSRRTKFFLMDNWQRVWIILLWVTIVLGLFTYKFIQFRHNKTVFGVMGYCVSVAKGSAETLKFNMALVLLPTCRNTLTWVRNKTNLNVAVPFDDNLNFHKLIAVGVAVGVTLHAIAHLACDFPRLLSATPEEYHPMKKYFGEVQPDSYWWFVKGVAGWTGVVMVVLMAIAFTLATPWFRRSKLKTPKWLGRFNWITGFIAWLNRITGFNAFWYSHHLFVIVYALLIVHSIKIYLTTTWYHKTTWMYLAVPVILYGFERLLRAIRSSIKTVTILKVRNYPGNVLALHMSKPNGFKYKSGQYMFVKCSAVSPFEWHPFSITSAPGDEYLSVHIRTLGDWTGQLKTVFSKVSNQQSSMGKSGLLRAESNEAANLSSYPKISIDGPYGAPAQDYNKYDIVMLVGLGIGATPMISIIKDIIHNMKIKMKGFRTQKAYFYWVSPEQGCSLWFKGIMDEVAEKDERHLIELHNYCTSVYEEGDARSALITMLQSLHHAKSGVDVVSETRVKSHFAKPDWTQVYKNIALHHPNTRVGVFYCGAPAPIKQLRSLALEFSHKNSTKFEFHKENF